MRAAPFVVFDPRPNAQRDSFAFPDAKPALALCRLTGARLRYIPAAPCRAPLLPTNGSLFARYV